MHGIEWSEIVIPMYNVIYRFFFFLNESTKYHKTMTNPYKQKPKRKEQVRQQ